MNHSLKTLLLAGLAAGVGTLAAQADPAFTTFATPPAGASSPDSITTGAGSVWVSYDGNTNSDGTVPGTFSTVVRYSTTGQVQQTFKIEGDVDGLKFNPYTNTVWALQNQDANSKLTVINTANNSTTNLTYAVTSASQGYDDVAFTPTATYLSYTNPSGPTDATLQQVTGFNAAGQITVTNLLTAGTTGLNINTGTAGFLPATADTDSLKLAPNGDLYQTTGNRDTLAIVHNPGTANQTLGYLTLSAGGKAVSGLDDSLFLTAGSGTLYATQSGSVPGKNDIVLSINVSGLAPDTLLAAIGSLNEIAIVNQQTGDLTPYLTGVAGIHGLEFVAATPTPEPSSVALLAGGALSLVATLRRRRR